MKKPRLRPSVFARGRWQCRGGPMQHGDYLTGYGATPTEAWLAWRVKQLEYEITNDNAHRGDETYTPKPKDV